jgi:Ger(x)C family germination protein
MLKKKKEIFLFIILTLSLLPLLTGCRNAKELSDLVMVSAVGIDRSLLSKKDLVVTAQIALPANIKSGSSGKISSSTGDGSGGGATKPYFNLQNDGATVFTAIRGMTQLVDNKLYLSHNEVIVFGREVAESGIRAHLDFFSKESESRPLTRIFIAKNSAYEILDAGDVFETTPAVDLKTLGENQKFNSYTVPVTLKDITNRFLSKTASAVIPMVEVESIGGKKLHKIAGMAVFKSDKMIGILNEKESRGLLFVLNKAVYGVMHISYKAQDITLELISANAKVRPRIEGRDIIFHVKVKTKSNLTEQSGTEPLDTGRDLNEMEKLQKTVIQDEIQTALEKAKSLHADIFAFGELLHKYYPGQWDKMEDQWDELFQTVKIEVNINNQITDIGTAGKPLAPEKKQ